MPSNRGLVIPPYLESPEDVLEACPNGLIEQL